MKKAVVLLVEAGGDLGSSLKGQLPRNGCEIVEAHERADLLRFIRTGSPDLVVIGSSRADAWGGLEEAKEIRRWNKTIPIILITASSSEELAIAALRTGITDYFKQPLLLDELVASITRCLADVPSPPLPASPGAIAFRSRSDPLLIGESSSMRQINAFIGQVASTDSTVLITGETGTGKELVAELIHRNSPRRQKPFVCINCAAIPDSLMESELFGYERGAFTGAHAQKEGALKLADEGTAFFDEIGDMSPYAQAKILRAIESKEVHRLGGKASIPIDVRVIAATNQDLEGRLSQGQFRHDLYFRLNVARIHLPPLRDRKEDIPALVHHYIRDLNARFVRDVEGFTEEALTSLLRYEWPGNVRELKNLLEAIFVNLPSGKITLGDVPEQFQRRLREAEGLLECERDRVLSALFSTNWNKSKAAQKLNWSRMTLYRKMTKYHIVKSHAARDQVTPAARDP